MPPLCHRRVAQWWWWRPYTSAATSPTSYNQSRSKCAARPNRPRWIEWWHRESPIRRCWGAMGCTTNSKYCSKSSTSQPPTPFQMATKTDLEPPCSQQALSFETDIVKRNIVVSGMKSEFGSAKWKVNYSNRIVYSGGVQYNAMQWFINLYSLMCYICFVSISISISKLKL